MRACIMALLQEYWALDCFKTTVNVNSVNNRISDSKGKMLDCGVSMFTLSQRSKKDRPCLFRFPWFIDALL